MRQVEALKGSVLAPQGPPNIIEFSLEHPQVWGEISTYSLCSPHLDHKIAPAEQKPEF